MPKINLLTVCTDDYPIEYAEILHKRFSQVSKLNVDHFCITDRPDCVSGWASPIEPCVAASGWWNKLNLFSGAMPAGWLLYMDLDIVIQDNFDREIKWAVKQNRKIACVSDAIGWMGVKFSSSLMVLKSGSSQEYFRQFKQLWPSLNERAGGDQVWLGPQLKNVLYLDKKFPNLKKNLKFHLAKECNGTLTLPFTISDEVKLVDCGGRPKPHELQQLSYVRTNWHEVLA